jgi:hypothetical protein
MGASESLLVAGIVCIVAAVVGGGVKLLGAEMPVLGSFPRQALLFLVGVAFLGASFAVNLPRPVAGAPAGAPPATPNSTRSTALGTGCGPATALDCLPTSSAPVSFLNPAAAKAAASQNMHAGLSTSAGQAQAISQGASGTAARLCGIVASNDSSPLGKHSAAVRLTTPGAIDGQATPACLAMAQSFL